MESKSWPERERAAMEELIPPGPYCYLIDITAQPKPNMEDGIAVVTCPHLTTKTFNDVVVPWCRYLKEGGIKNSHSDEEWDKLVEYFGSEDNVFDFLHLDLLWDECKECGMGGNYNYTKEQAIEWINQIREHKKTI